MSDDPHSFMPSPYEKDENGNCILSQYEVLKRQNDITQWYHREKNFNWTESQREKILREVGGNLDMTSPIAAAVFFFSSTTRTAEIPIEEIQKEFDEWLTIDGRAAFEVETGAFLLFKYRKGGRCIYRRKTQQGKWHDRNSNYDLIVDHFFSGRWVIEDGYRDPCHFGMTAFRKGMQIAAMMSAGMISLTEGLTEEKQRQVIEMLQV